MIQLKAGRFFLHEHPAGAKSRQEPCITAISNRNDVHTVVGHQCQYGLTTPGLDGHPTPALKQTRWMSNSHCMLARLDSRCPRDHRHQPLLGGRARDAHIYPDRLTLEILRGMVDQQDATRLQDEEEEDEEETRHAIISNVRAGLDSNNPSNNDPTRTVSNSSPAQPREHPYRQLAPTVPQHLPLVVPTFRKLTWINTPASSSMAH